MHTEGMKAPSFVSYIFQGKQISVLLAFLKSVDLQSPPIACEVNEYSLCTLDHSALECLAVCPFMVYLNCKTKRSHSK